MTLLRRLATLGLSLIVASPGAWAQTELLVGNTLTLDGIQLEVASCSVTIGGNAQSNCSSISMEQVSTGRDTLSYELIGTGGGPALSDTSDTATSSLALVLTATANSGFHPAGTVVTSAATLTTLGYMNFTGGTTGTVAQASTAFSGGTTAATLTDNLTAKAAGSGEQTVVSSPASTFSPSTASFTITEDLTLNPNGKSISALSLNQITLKLTTTPEPATVSLVLLGLGGLAIARRRRQASTGSVS
jgi:hypothetical protein